MGKGQIFIIIAIIVIVVIVGIKTSLNLINILENKRFLELGSERSEYQNLRNELTKTIQISYNQTNISTNVNDFIRFSKDAFASRATTLTGVIVTISFPQVASNTDTRLNVSFMNYLDEDLDTLNFTFNSTRLNFTNIRRSSLGIFNFTFKTQSDINFTFEMNYTTSNVNRTENITVPVEIGTTKFIGFFDIKIDSNRLEQRDKFTEVVTLNVTKKV